MSRKLEKNGLWESSRMMLPEHREALAQRRKPQGQGQAQAQAEAEAATAAVAKPNVPTQEELRLIRNYALLPIMLSIVENNYRNIETSSYALKKLYMTATQALLNLIHADLTQVRKTLKERKIKVHEEERIDGAIGYRFVCRGYEDSFAITRDVVRAEISVKIAEYISVLFRQK
jgi:Icc-related predicted phosphoesterase